MLALSWLERISHVHHVWLLLDWRHVHWVGHCSWVAHVWNKITLFLLLLMHCCLRLDFGVDLFLAVSLVVYWWIIATLNHWVWHALVLVLVRIHVQRLSIWLRWHSTSMVFHNAGRQNLTAIHIHALMLSMLGVSWLTWNIGLVLSSGVCSLLLH